ncbi:fungal hydrophobin-domain-containing protein [Dichomitus squalens]|uniref:Hydrophobin n=2 Tax=Dichomitus squalens TaxID=114155 RepID=A0A4Q9Q2K6_9APHY|nr:hydrophobin-315 [Dichomitus squalens LYAD-421 SS1]EJF60582.1 hydrophobin-315 [Dichomitus squalens LYAD-421 SS1]TBU30094.1 fungal hydrophobin-domain-containing protein [Dichomitus squalens]TBU44188.1 fungal hydrophobin-domain-containing protein [Dichomitus squalens]TBU61477.1 fungal hydrophobin-domain-containing protein [Dichomitus squalens]
MPGGSPPPSPTTVTITQTASGPEPTSACTTGSIQCCDSTEAVSATDPDAAAILGLLGVVVEGVDVLVGLSCSPLTVIGVGGGDCSSNVVCCEDNAYGGLISIGCVPISL